MSRNDLISRGEFANAIANLWEKGEILAVLQGMETADPVRHGHWVDLFPSRKLELKWFECSECGVSRPNQYKYCPHCGALMF